MSIKAPWFSKDGIRAAAAQFLETYHPSGTIPVPIEGIIDAQFGMDIVPVPGLRKNFDIDAYLTSDLQEIRVDQGVYENFESRYRFSLAHELAHRLLHGDVYRQLQFQSISQWKTARDQISERDYSLIEWHANFFAGLVLVPPILLSDQIKLAQQRLANAGMSLDNATPDAWDTLQTWIGEAFSVSWQVIDKRGRDDGHWTV